MITLLDRYSYFYKLLPLLLTGIEDEVPDIASKSLQMFETAGKQWEGENEQDIKVDIFNFFLSFCFLSDLNSALKLYNIVKVLCASVIT